MYRGDKMKYYTIHEMTEILGVTAQTLRNWDKSGKLKPHHTSPNGYRYYSEDDLNQLLNKPVREQGKRWVTAVSVLLYSVANYRTNVQTRQRR